MSFTKSVAIDLEETHMSEKVPLVKMTNIEKRFGGIHAVSGMNLELYEGEVLGLLGHNGAGKSTLIKLQVHIILMLEKSISVAKVFPSILRVTPKRLALKQYTRRWR